MGYSSVVGQRALREIYLLPFMFAQKYAKPWCYMTAYVFQRIHHTYSQIMFPPAITVLMASMFVKIITYSRTSSERNGVLMDW